MYCRIGIPSSGASCVTLPLFLVLVVAVSWTKSTMAKTAELKVAQANGQFTTNLYKALSGKPGKNVFFSPLSAHAVLSMAYQGAQGTTAESFANALKVPQASLAAKGYDTLITRLNNVPNVTLLMANRVYLKDGKELLPEFNRAITKKFHSVVEQVNFKQNVEAAKKINCWVEEQTKERIKDLIQSDDLNEDTALVLVNAIYFKGNWAHQFNKDRTKTEHFYLNNVDTINVEMMHHEAEYFYKQDDALQAQVLELPYTNMDIRMVIILPNQKDGIAALEAKLQNVDITTITEGTYKTEVNVALPKFKIETTIDLQDSLTVLGLGEIFDDKKANFRGMIPLNPDEKLYVSKAVQKAFIEVNEEGAEAAAATDMGLIPLCMTYPEDFIADHPFIFILTSKAFGVQNVLFCGRLCNNLASNTF